APGADVRRLAESRRRRSAELGRDATTLSSLVAATGAYHYSDPSPKCQQGTGFCLLAQVPDRGLGSLLYIGGSVFAALYGISAFHGYAQVARCRASRPLPPRRCPNPRVRRRSVGPPCATPHRSLPAPVPSP